MPSSEQECNAAGTTRLSASDVPALQKLYADGEASGESPDFFFPSMVTDGVFHGIYEDTAIVAVAGTRLVARDEGPRRLATSTDGATDAAVGSDAWS